MNASEHNFRARKARDVEAGQPRGVLGAPGTGLSDGAPSGATWSAEAWMAFLTWWIWQLLNALLRPMFCRFRELRRDGNHQAQSRQADRYEDLFYRMLDRCDCYPFCAIVERCGLFFLDDQEMHELQPGYSLEEALQ